MIVVRLVPVFLSALLLAAHFSRADNLPLVLGSLVFPLVLLVRRPWSARAVQALLALGGLEWVRTMVVLAAGRSEAGEPWLRLAAILGAVAVLTFASSLVFRGADLKQRYSL